MPIMQTKHPLLVFCSLDTQYSVCTHLIVCPLRVGDDISDAWPILLWVGFGLT